MKKALRFNIPKEELFHLLHFLFCPYPHNRKQPLPSSIFTACQFSFFLFKSRNGLWQHIKIAYEKKARLHSCLSLKKCQPKALLSGKHNK